jgi:von Willebrand factor A domain-containing protein 3
LVEFNTKVNKWRDRLVQVDGESINSALQWIQTLSAQGGTNILGAIKFGLSDLNTEAIYLLTDGRPDQVS